MDSRAWAHTGAAERGRARRRTLGRRTRKVNTETGLWTLPWGSEAQRGRLHLTAFAAWKAWGPGSEKPALSAGILVPVTLAVELPLWSCGFLWQCGCAHEMRPRTCWVVSPLPSRPHSWYPVPGAGDERGWTPAGQVGAGAPGRGSHLPFSIL